MKINVANLFGGWKVVDAIPVIIPGYEEFSFCVTSAIEPRNKGLVYVTEVTSGTNIGIGRKSTNEAIAYALSELNKHTKEHIRSSIDKCIAKYGVPPQVTDEEVPSGNIPS